MNFSRFSVDSTNIFPIVNSVSGGQYATEWNLRSRESVATDSSIQYWVGPSYTHSAQDFEVTYDIDSVGNRVGDTAIIVQPGRAVINGHFVESLAPVRIDLFEENQKLAANHQATLSGNLSIGLVAMYSTEATMAGSLLTYKAQEDDEEVQYYEGIQIVILPTEQFKAPIDTPTDEMQITAHLRLADFTYRNGHVEQLTPNANMYKVLSSDKIMSVSTPEDSKYVSKEGLDPNKIYTFAGYGVEDGHDTWCDSIDSLIIWDSTPNLVQGTNLGATTAKFHYLNGVTYLLLPHKQPDNFKDANGTLKYYEDKVLPLPAANFNSSLSGGVVTPEYTQAIHDIKDQVDRFYSFGNGSLRGFVDVLDSRNPDDSEVDAQNRLPEISTSWVIGDYICVAQDNTVEVSEDETRGPSTVYLVIPGYVQSLTEVTKSPTPLDAETLKGLGLTGTLLDYIDKSDEALPTPFDYSEYVEVGNYRGQSSIDYFMFSFASDMELLTEQPSDWSTNYRDYYVYSPQAGEYLPVPHDYSDLTYTPVTQQNPTAYDIGRSGYDSNTWNQYAYTTSAQGEPEFLLHYVDPSELVHRYQIYMLYHAHRNTQAPDFYAYTKVAANAPEPENWATTYNTNYWTQSGSTYNQNAQSDWELAKAQTGGLYTRKANEYYQQVSGTSATTYLYYKVSTTTKYQYSDPMWMTGQMPLATETIVGGFYNVPEDTTGAGYVYRDTDGRLRLLDYSYLASGVLAYQLGQDFATTTSANLATIQAELNEYVNSRVVFANESQLNDTTKDSDIINVTINLSASDTDYQGSITIMNLDSRFDACLKVTLTGECNDYTINFVNCQKLRINNQLSGVAGTNYHINVINCNLYYDPDVLNILKTVEGLNLWYKHYNDTDMYLSVHDMTVETLYPDFENADTYWNTESPNDNHYTYGLKSITFTQSGMISGCTLLVGDNITGNNELGRFASVFEFSLPQTDALRYPENCLPIGQPLRVSGEFVSCYKNNTADAKYVFKETKFNAISQYSRVDWNPAEETETVVNYPGQIAFVTELYELDRINGLPSNQNADAWTTGKLYQFHGGMCE